MPQSRVLGLIDLIADPGTFRSWNLSELGIDPDIGTETENEGYATAIADAQRTTGSEESVVAGEALVEGNRICVIFGDFDFLAGSVGRTACQIVIAATERARACGMPVLASPASGGTRMQEGTPTFVLMADVAAAVARYRRAGLPWVTWLRNPTTGGVMATWGSLGTVTFGEPRALVGFLGPRVFEALNGEPFPSQVQTSENLALHGVIDGVADADALRQIVTSVGLITNGGRPTGAAAPADVESGESPAGWACVQATRNPQRPTSNDVLGVALTNRVPICGTGAGEAASAIDVWMGLWSGRPVVVIAQNRAAQNDGHSLGPAALRVARRGLAIANELNLPVVTIVDTAGAELSVQAEQGALAGEIARCLADMSQVTSPTISVLLGMGCGGAALALLPADRVLSAVHGWISPLPLEGASIIRYRSTAHTEQMAQEQRVSAGELFKAGFVDVLIPEDPDAAAEPAPFVARLVATVSANLAELVDVPESVRAQQRLARYSGGLNVS